MASVRSDDLVVGLHGALHADGDGLLADGEMAEAADEFLLVEDLRCLFHTTHGDHVLVHPDQAVLGDLDLGSGCLALVGVEGLWSQRAVVDDGSLVSKRGSVFTRQDVWVPAGLHDELLGARGWDGARIKIRVAHGFAFQEALRPAGRRPSVRKHKSRPQADVQRLHRPKRASEEAGPAP